MDPSVAHTVPLSAFQCDSMSTCQCVCTFQCQHVSKPACQRVCTFAYRYVTMLARQVARQPSHMSARRRHASMSAVSSSRSVCQHQRACTFAYRHVSKLARQQPVSRSPCLEVCISLCQNVSISVSSGCLHQCVCKHTNLSACQNVSKSECLQACISPCQHLSASGSKRFSRSVSAYQHANMTTCQHVNMWKRRHVRLWAFYQCEHVFEPLSRRVSMSACLCVQL